MDDLHEHRFLEPIESIFIDSREAASLWVLRIHVLLPGRLVTRVCERRGNVLEGRAGLFEPPERPPFLIRHDAACFVLFVLEIRGRSSQEEAPLRCCDLVCPSLYRGGVQERIEKFVPLKETSADTHVEGSRDIVDQDAQPRLELIRLLRLLESQFEQAHEEL